MNDDAVNFESRILHLIEETPDGITEKELASKLEAELSEVKAALALLADGGAIERREVGNVVTWYPLETTAVHKVLIVEDDHNINNLMKASIGKGYAITQAFDGNEASRKVREVKPDLVLLDLMLQAGPNGLEICQEIKKDPALKHAIVIIVSAADERRNRFQGIRYGADYYVKKPFDPKMLRALVNIFLKKKGKKFDPLVDLPDTARLSKEIEHVIKDGDFEISNLRIVKLDDFSSAYGKPEGMAVVRLVSQILQDKVTEWDARKGFVGYIGEGEFVVGGGKNETSMVLSEVMGEFERVLPFIYQSKFGQPKMTGFDLSEVFAAEERPDQKRVSLKAEPLRLDSLLTKRDEINKAKPRPDIGSYTLSELQEMLGSSNVDLTVRATPGGVSISASKPKK